MHAAQGRDAEIAGLLSKLADDELLIKSNLRCSPSCSRSHPGWHGDN